MGGPAAETVRFGVEGWEYEIDLSEENARTFRQQVAPFAEHARRGRARTAPPAGTHLLQPSAQRRHPGVGERQGHRGQRPGASQRALSSSTKPPPGDSGARLDHGRPEPILACGVPEVCSRM
jgi:hypothetical protein